MSDSAVRMHVETIHRTYKDKRYTSHLLRRGWREGGKVKKETLANLSHLPDAAIEAIRRVLRGECLVGFDDAFEVERSRPHGHVAAVRGTLRRLGLHEVLSSRPSRQRDLCEAMIVARILEPRSKLATVRSLRTETLHHTLGEQLGVERADEDELYEAMDWLVERQGRIEQALAKRHLKSGGMALVDLTSAHMEGRTCPLARRGYSRDGKGGKLQIEFALMTDDQGCPVAVQVFSGNTADPATVVDHVSRLRDKFGLQHMVLVGDRGTLTDARIRKDLKPHDFDWVTALRAPAIANLRDSGSLQLSLFDQKDLAEITDPAYPGERLIVCRNPLLAAERARKRLELLDATEASLAKVAAATARQSRPLRGKETIGVRVGRILGRYKVGKHFKVNITDEGLSYERDAGRIAQEAALDGFYVVRTSVAADVLPAEDAVRCYKRLADVERAFRSFKTVDLKVRPVYHVREERVRAHVLLCMLAYHVEWHMRRDLAPLLFDDHQPEAGEAKRTSVVAPAQRSDAALRKAHTKRADDGLPVQSFQDLLKDLATVVLNRVRTPTGQTFETMTQPTNLQRRAFELLKVNPAP